MANNSLFGQILQFLSGILSKGDESIVSVNIPLDKPVQTSAPVDPPKIDWMSPDCKVTDHFTVADMSMLHGWNRLANEMDGFNDAMKTKMVTLANKLEEIRALLGCPMNVHCCFRSQQYNQEIVKAIPNDVHAQGLACDFDSNKNMTCDQVKTILMPHLESMGIRMEDNGAGASWVHVDLHPVIHARFFKP